MNPKNSKKITDSLECGSFCDFGDGDFSRLGVAYLTHTTGANKRRTDGRTNERHSHVDFLNLIVDNLYAMYLATVVLLTAHNNALCIHA